jgi:RNA polymerase sigma-70 factor (ECF subfamily)
MSDRGYGRDLSMDEARLIERAREGDAQAFEALVRGRYSRIYWLARQVVGNDEDARDVCQAVFIRLWRVLDRYDPRYPFSTWLHRMVMNLAIDHLRREGRHRHRAEPEDSTLPARDARAPHHQLERAELQRVFEELAEQLAPQQRAVFVLREMEEHSSEEVAAILGISASTVRNHLFQARRILRKELERRYPEYLPPGRQG